MSLTTTVSPLAGIVLAGGASRRMGRPKAWLPFGRGPVGPETMLQRVVRLVSSVAQPIVVVAAPGQALPPLPSDALLASDDWPGEGPLAALVTGLRRLVGRADAAYVCGCDVPLLVPAFVTALAGRLADRQIAVPIHHGHLRPLPAVCRLTVLPAAERLLADGERSLTSLCQAAAACRIDAEALRSVDPDLRSLLNVNTPADCAQALRLADAVPT
jgi:molybdopterin-guanine dinucleotide biosynthesis protein A